MHNSLSPLTVEQLRKQAPSVYSDQPMPGVSAKYRFIRTADILSTMGEAGFHVVSARQSASRSEDGINYVKHMLRLVHGDYLTSDRKMVVGDVVPQIVLTNSHNRTSSFGLEAGLFRLVCSNGMMASAADFAGVRVLHNDPAIHDHILEGTQTIRAITETVAIPTVEKMTKKVLTPALALEFATAATYLKYGEERPDHAEALLGARRLEDEGLTLWNVLNRVQENVVRGGYEAKDRAGRNTKARGITSVDKDREFNLNLWTLGAQVAELA